MDIVAFGRLAELCTAYLAKGSSALVDGRLQCREWQNQSGERRKSYEVVIDTVQFLSPRQGGEDGRGRGPAPPVGKLPDPAPLPAPADPADDDLPF